jgi:hypothetical protein
MKKASLICVCAAMLVLSGSAAWAVLALPTHGYITITDCDSPGSDWTSVDLTHLTGISSSLGTPGAESGIASGILTSTSNAGFLVPGTRYIRLMEPNNIDVSDVVKLEAGSVDHPDSSYSQSFTISFYSDGYVSFSDYITASVGYPAITETGNLQDVSGDTLLNTNDAFGLFVKSEVCENPLPGTLLLLGSALIGLAGCRMRKR